jgi:hypothetical protein
MADHHRADHVRPPLQIREQMPLARLWLLQKGKHLRMCALYAHAMGFEIKVVDQHGDFVWTGVFRSEPEAMLEAASRQGVYQGRGWRPLTPES